MLTPGLVNAHTHLQFSDDADLASSGLEFFDWIRAISVRGRTHTAAEWEVAAGHGAAQLLATGTTCVADVVTHAPALGPVAAAGLAGISYLEVVACDPARWPDVRAQLLDDLAAAPDGRSVGIAPHTLYTLDVAVVAALAALARERGLRLHTHVAESRHEVSYIACGEGAFAGIAEQFGLDFALTRDGGSGRTPVGELDVQHGLGLDCHVAHGVHVTPEDRALLRERGSVVALCIRSNRLLQAGDPPVAAYLAEGNRVAVGTDSLASSPDLDLLAELAVLRDAALSQGAAADGLAEQLFAAATLGGAAALGLSDVGRLEAGSRADLAVFDVPTDGAPYDALVDEGAGRCVATVLGGELVHSA